MYEHDYERLFLDESKRDNDGWPILEIMLRVDGKLICAEVSKWLWKPFVSESIHNNKTVYQNTMFSCLFHRIVLRAQCLYSLDINYWDIWAWALDNIHTKWNMCELSNAYSIDAAESDADFECIS